MGAERHEGLEAPPTELRLERYLSDPPSQAKILVVDDSPLLLAVVTKYLTLYGYGIVRQAADGAEALQIAKSWVPDVLLTDIQMPIMDGYDLCHSVRKDPNLADMPILIMTGVESSEQRTAAFSAGATDLISKPIDPLELKGRLKIHLDRRNLIRRLSEYKERIARELDIARSMQEALLPSPSHVDDLKSKYPIEIASFYKASLGLGGDLWAATDLDRDRLLVCLTDFSGHGVGAALNTFRFHTFLNSLKIGDHSPADLLAALNGFLKSNLQTGQFATMFCATVDFSKNSLTYASASAPPALVQIPGKSDRFLTLNCEGYPLGILDDASFECLEVDFPPGAELFLYSDALIETPDPPNSVFTPETLADLLSSFEPAETLEQTLTSVLDHLAPYAKAGFEDDLTILHLRHLQP